MARTQIPDSASSQFFICHADATLLDGQGNPVDGETVTFNINGVFYNRITRDGGQAKLNINLNPGEFIITSSYNGTSISNTVKIEA